VLPSLTPLPGRDVLVNPAGRIVLEPGASLFSTVLFGLGGKGGGRFGTLRWAPVVPAHERIDLFQVQTILFVIICEQKIPSLFCLERTRYSNKYHNAPRLSPIYIVNISRPVLFLVIVQKKKVSRQSSEGIFFLFGCAMDLTDVPPLLWRNQILWVRLRTHLCFPRFPPLVLFCSPLFAYTRR